MKQKSELMQKMRAERKMAGLIRAEFWLTPEQKAIVMRYVGRIKKLP